eukprot:m.94926 g.94926  ORF g.94926 m.94926 type:complete len:127 (+) comp13468_c0_seq1:291-671(+)
MKGFVFEGEDIVEKKEEGHVVPKHGSGKKKDNLVQKQNSEDETEGKDVSALIIGLAPDQFDYGKLTSCFKLVKENNATLIALNKARYIMTETNGLCLGAGSFVSALEYACGVEGAGRAKRRFAAAS